MSIGFPKKKNKFTFQSGSKIEIIIKNLKNITQKIVRKFQIVRASRFGKVFFTHSETSVSREKSVSSFKSRLH